MTKNLEKNIQKYSLGLEELALALGMINRPDLGQEMMKNIYDDLNEEQGKARLSSASHSLLARGLCGLSPNAQPVLEQNLEAAIFPLARFDYLLYLGVVQNNAQINTTLHIIKGRTFTSHFTQMGVVHVLEHGPVALLGEYLEDILDQVGNGAPSSEGRPIHLDVLGQGARASDNQQALSAAIASEGWGKSEAGQLAEDLLAQSFRATLLRLEVDYKAPSDTIKDAAGRSLLVLKGQKRSWLFEFETTKDNPLGRGWCVGRKAFEKKLAEFLA